MKELLEQVQKLTTAEYRRAAQKFGRANNSPHESYAVILEEYEEAIEEGKLFGWHMRCYWDAIKTNKKTKARLKHLQSIAEKAAAEWVQVAAMCYKAQQNKQTEKPELPEGATRQRLQKGETMFICHSCGSVFDEPCEKDELMGEAWGAPARDRYWVSPCCGGNYSAAQHCRQCSTPILGDIPFCDSCAKVLRERFVQLMSDNFTVEEQEYVLDYAGQAFAEAADAKEAV